MVSSHLTEATHQAKILLAMARRPVLVYNTDLGTPCLCVILWYPCMEPGLLNICCVFVILNVHGIFHLTTYKVYKKSAAYI